MPEHLVTNVGPTVIRVIRTNGEIVSVLPGDELVAEIQAIGTEPRGRVEFTVAPRNKE